MRRFFGAMLLLVLVALVACGPAPAPTPAAQSAPSAKAQVIPPADGRLWGIKVRTAFDQAEVCQNCPNSIRVTGWYFFPDQQKICPDTYRLGLAEQKRYNRRGECEFLNEPTLMYPSQGTDDVIEDITSDSAP